MESATQARAEDIHPMSKAGPAAPINVVPLKAPPLPDELLGSYLCRIAALNGFASFATMARALVPDWPTHAKGCLPISSSFPSSMQARHLLDALGWQEEDAWEALTVIPYWRSLGCKALAVYAFTGWPLRSGEPSEGTATAAPSRSAVTHPAGLQPLKWCPACVKEDSREHGTPYFHREHQLPLTQVCTKHDRGLVSQCPSCRARWDAYALPVTLTSTCPCGAALDRVNVQDQRRDAWRSLALINRQLFTQPDLHFDKERLWEKALAALSAEGETAILMDRRDDVTVRDAIARRLRDHYGDSGLELIQRDGLNAEFRTRSTRDEPTTWSSAAVVPELCAVLATFLEDLRPLQETCGADSKVTDSEGRQAVAVSAGAIFADWMDCQRLRGQRYAERSAESVRSIWLSWARWLLDGPQPVAWHQALPAHVEAYRRSIKPLSTKRTGTSRPTTGERYERWLHAIYEHAYAVGLIDVMPTVRWSAVIEERQVEFLDSKTLDYLRAHLPNAWAHWRDTQDRAILSLLLHLGVTVDEICSLQLKNLRGGEHGPMHVHVDSLAGAAPRILDVPQPACQELRAWIAVRPERESEALFVRTRGSAAIYPVAVFRLVNEWLLSLEGALPTTVVRLGPELLRSSVISEWIAQELPTGEVLRRSGLANVHCLRRYPKGQRGTPSI
jgi:integrase